MEDPTLVGFQGAATKQMYLFVILPTKPTNVSATRNTIFSNKKQIEYKSPIYSYKLSFFRALLTFQSFSDFLSHNTIYYLCLSLCFCLKMENNFIGLFQLLPILISFYFLEENFLPSNVLLISCHIEQYIIYVCLFA